MTKPLEDERNPVEVLAEEFLERHRKGESPSVDEYTAAHPGLEEEIRALFPTMLAMERLKLSRESSRGGHASLGPHKLERLGDFELVRELGRGGMGVVFEAEQKSLGRRVAVKVLPRQQLMHARQLSRFEREARTAAGLHHTNIVPIFGTGEQDGFHYYVMQFISGPGLDDVIRELRKDPTGDSPLLAPLIPPSDRRLGRAAAIARVGLQAAEALAFAHEHGVLHRDIKPGNLLLDARGTLWITDFGLALALEESDVTKTGDVVGTLAYMAPEQFRGHYDERTDIYGLGLTLYELMTLHSAYQQTDRSQLIHAISNRDPEHPRKYGMHVPVDLVTIVMKCVARDPKHRYASARALADDLEAFLEGRPIAARPVSALQRGWRWAGRNRGTATLAASTVVLLFVALIVGWALFAQTRTSLQGEREAKQLAEGNLNLALQALNDLFRGIGGPMTRVSTVADSSLAGQENGDGTNGEAGAVLEPLTQPTVSQSDATMLARMLELYEDLAEANLDNQRVLGDRAHAYRSIGDIQQKLGNWADALKAYDRATELYGSLPGLSVFERSLTLAMIHNEIGRVLAARGERRKAAQAHVLALRLLDPLCKDSDSARLRYEFVRTVNFYDSPGPFRDFARRPPRNRGERESRGGSGSRSERRSAPARPVTQEMRDRALRYASFLVRQEPNNDTFRLAHANTRLARARRASWRGEREEAVDELQRSLSDFASLVGENPNVDYFRYAWAEALSRSSALFVGEQRLEQLDKAKRLHTDLATRQGANPMYRAARAEVLYLLAREQSGEGPHTPSSFVSAERAIREALKDWGSLTEDFPDIEAYRQGLHLSLRQYARILERTDRRADAIRVMKESVLESPLSSWADDANDWRKEGVSRLRQFFDLHYLGSLIEDDSGQQKADREREAEQLRERAYSLLPERMRESWRRRVQYWRSRRQR